MKKILLGILMLFGSKFFTRTTAGGLILLSTKIYSQTFVWASITGTKNCMLFKQLSPTSDYGNRWNVIYVNKDSLLFRHPHVYQDSLKLRNDIMVGSGKLMWMDNTTGHMNASRMDSIHINWDHINSRPTNLNAFTNGPGYITSETDPTVSSASKAITASDTVKWNNKFNVPSGNINEYVRGNGTLATFPTNLSSFSNGPGYITGYTPTLTSSNGSIGAVGGNTVAISITSTQINSAIGGTPVLQQYSVQPGSGVTVQSISPNVQRVSVDTNATTSGTNAIMYVGKANSAISTLSASIDTKLSTSTFNSTSVTINGTTQAISSNPSFIIPTESVTTYTSGTGISISGSTITNTAPDQSVTLTAGNGIVIGGTYPNFTISLAAPSITANPARATTTNTANNTTGSFTVSSKPAFVSYYLSCQVTNPLLVGTSAATVFLEYSTNGGSSWISYQQNGASSGVGVTVTIQLTTGQTGYIGATIPAGANVRIRQATSGTASVTYIGGQETTY